MTAEGGGRPHPQHLKVNIRHQDISVCVRLAEAKQRHGRLPRRHPVQPYGGNVKGGDDELDVGDGEGAAQGLKEAQVCGDEGDVVPDGWGRSIAKACGQQRCGAE